MFSRYPCCKRETGRSGLVRSALEKLSLFSPTFPVRRKYGAENFAVCGRRLRGHVPSKNTSPAALSWSSLTSPTAPILFVPARCFLLSFVGRRRAVSVKIPKQTQKGCVNVDAALLEFMVEMENRIMPQPELPSWKMQSSPPALLPPPASSSEHGSRPAAILRIPQR